MYSEDLTTQVLATVGICKSRRCSPGAQGLTGHGVLQVFLVMPPAWPLKTESTALPKQGEAEGGGPLRTPPRAQMRRVCESSLWLTLPGQTSNGHWNLKKNGYINLNTKNNVHIYIMNNIYDGPRDFH